MLPLSLSLQGFTMIVAKRIFDITFSFVGLVVFSPILLVFMILVFIQDGYSPIYRAQRIGKNEKTFRMLKLRSMVVDADKAGIDTVSLKDERVTKIGHIIRKYKIDELLQLWNVFKGDMSFVGPRPNVSTETELYTQIEKKLLLVRPGITDFASIVFSDLGTIVSNSSDVNLSYNQLVRPWKSRLGLIYIEKMSFILDVKIILLTIVSFFSRKLALQQLNKILESLNVSKEIIKISMRQDKLVPTPPPGAMQIVTER